MITAAFVLAIFVLVTLLVGFLFLDEADRAFSMFVFVGLAALVALCVLAIVQFGIAQ